MNFTDSVIATVRKNKEKLNLGVMTAYTGTTRQFDKLSMGKSRTRLNEKYQGDGIFLTLDERVAWKYADAARNQTFEPEAFRKDLYKVFSKTSESDAQFVVGLYDTMMELGYDGWDKAQMDFVGKSELSDDDRRAYWDKMRAIEEAYDLNINDLTDCFESVEGYPQDSRDDTQELFNVFNSSLPTFSIYDIEFMEQLGFEAALPIHQVLECKVVMNNVLETADRYEARAAKENGFDVVIYSGEDCVDGVPEIQVLDESLLEITARTIRHRVTVDTDDGYYYEDTFTKKVEPKSPKLATAPKLTL